MVRAQAWEAVLVQGIHRQPHLQATWRHSSGFFSHSQKRRGCDPLYQSKTMYFITDSEKEEKD
ncbi:Pleckstrin homology domain-containing protein 1 [Senna tora]|uniref:Pleckstrin homology domain-containing protein 1 n=1 Tax=Senna tora TaxID=362788 RepID=A0A834TH41_9FABA|nr:Pleckstrin homology domain-containing protein 1 [Senna tora]